MSKAPSNLGQSVEEKEGAIGKAVDRQLPTVRRAVEYFKAEHFRAGQKEAIEEVDDAFQQGYRYVLLEGPTGSGKSFIAMTFAQQSQSCHTLTSQKVLQDQYEKDFGDEAFIMKGRNAYSCAHDNKGKSCAEGICRRIKKIRHENCPYRIALSIAADSPIVVHNFDSFYFQCTFAHAFDPRALLVIDECHNVENKYLNFISFTISNKYNRHLTIPQFAAIQQYDTFLKEQYEETCVRIKVLEDFEEISGEDVKEKDELMQLQKKLRRYLDIRERGESTEYVFDYNDYKVYQSVTFRPVFVGGFAAQSLFPNGSKVLMMSATILSKKIFCESVGIDPDDVYYVSVPSFFPAKNRPIVKDYAGSMNHKNINDTLPKLVAKISMLLQRHATRKGIIQTHSEKVAKYIQSHLFDTRLTFRKDYKTVVEMLQVHIEKNASFIVASGLKEGLDLYEDLSRVQIIAKVPYPDLGDKRVRRRKELNNSWYSYMTALMFVQSIGRSVRSETDRAITYVLDESFDLFYKFNRRFIPDYIKKAVRK